MDAAQSWSAGNRRPGEGPQRTRVGKMVRSTVGKRAGGTTTTMGMERGGTRVGGRTMGKRGGGTSMDAAWQQCVWWPLQAAPLHTPPKKDTGQLVGRRHSQPRELHRPRWGFHSVYPPKSNPLERVWPGDVGSWPHRPPKGHSAVYPPESGLSEGVRPDHVRDSPHWPRQACVRQACLIG